MELRGSGWDNLGEVWVEKSGRRTLFGAYCFFFLSFFSFLFFSFYLNVHHASVGLSPLITGRGFIITILYTLLWEFAL